MTNKIKDNKLSEVAGGLDKEITYKYKKGDLFSFIMGIQLYYEVIEPTGLIDDETNTPTYKCYMFSSFSNVAPKKEMIVSEKLLSEFQKINKPAIIVN